MIYIEIFEPLKVDGIETQYEISNTGFVKSKFTGKILKACPRNGYLSVTICYNSIKRRLNIHRLVAEHFVFNPDPSTKIQVNHIDGDKSNNCAWNLEWVTRSENQQHALKTGLKVPLRGVKCPWAKHTEKTIRKICKMLKKNHKIKDICKKLKVNRELVSEIKHGRRWKSISYEYNI